jgi:hypothetical protein
MKHSTGRATGGVNDLDRLRVLEHTDLDRDRDDRDGIHR